jgi:NADPH:quinone reductase-like Zn-dependent oxidoreductase
VFPFFRVLLYLDLNMSTAQLKACERLARLRGHLEPPTAVSAIQCVPCAGASGGLLCGQVAIITGAGQGVGAATARLFAREGARVVVSDLDGAKAQQVRRHLASRNPHPWLARVARGTIRCDDDGLRCRWWRRSWLLGGRLWRCRAT